eukprot:scaffold4865_cov83-Cyclotella_meneghiniana.AAC.12
MVSALDTVGCFVNVTRSHGTIPAFNSLSTLAGKPSDPRRRTAPTQKGREVVLLVNRYYSLERQGSRVISKPVSCDKVRKMCRCDTFCKRQANVRTQDKRVEMSSSSLIQRPQLEASLACGSLARIQNSITSVWLGFHSSIITRASIGWHPLVMSSVH